MKKVLYVLSGVIIGVMTTIGVTAYAESMEVKTNTIPIKVDGNKVDMKGYNIKGFTYFQLRDVGEATGFKTEFKNNTIHITTK